MGPGEAGRGLSHPTGMALCLQGPWSTAGAALHLLQALPARLGVQHFPSQPRVPSPGWTCLWSGWGPRKSQPCGLGSPWLLGTFAPCPWVLSRSPFGLIPTTEVSSHPGAQQFSQTLPLRPVARRGLSHPHVSFPHGSGGKGRGAARVPAGQPLPLPRFGPCRLSAESRGVWEAPRAKPGWMRHHKFPLPPGQGNGCPASPWAGPAASWGRQNPCKPRQAPTLSLMGW